MQNQPPVIGNLPHNNPLFDEANDNPQHLPPPSQLPAKIPMVSNERTLRDYVLPNLEMVQGSITKPTIMINNFEIKPTMIQMIHNNLQFRDTMTEDPNQHLKWFLQLCDTFKYNGVTDDAIYLQLFPFSLINNAFSWLDSQAPGSITTWDELTGKFLQKFFPINKTVKLRNGIAKKREFSRRVGVF